MSEKTQQQTGDMERNLAKNAGLAPPPGQAPACSTAPVSLKMKILTLDEKLTILSFRGIIFLILCFFLLYSPVMETKFSFAIFSLLNIYLLSDLALLWIPTPKFTSPRLLTVLFLSDMAFISWFIYVTQGWNTDLYLVYFVVIFMSGMQINIRQSFLVGTVAGLLYLALWTNMNPRGDFLNTALLLRLPFFYIVSFFTVVFAQQAGERERLLKQLALDADKMRKQMSDKLETIRSRQEAIFNNIPDMAWLKDKESRFIAVNEPFGKFCGVCPAELLGKTDLDIWPRPLAERYRADDREVMQSGKRKCVEEPLAGKDKKMCWLETIKMPIYNNLGEVTGTVGLARDITERKRNEQELKERNDELARFSYAVSHDLKSPLVTITTFLGYLEEDIKERDAEGVARDLGYIRTAADKMRRLLKELLDLSRIGHKMNPYAETPLGALLEEALALTAGNICKRGIKVRITDERVALFGDRQRLLEVFQNLFDNAAKYMGEQPEPFIEAGVDLSGAEPVFFVRDNGIGIDPRHQANIFGLFEKLDPATEGTGMGLALVRRIIEVHGGRIWVESEGAGKGTTFRFTLANIKKTSGGKNA